MKRHLAQYVILPLRLVNLEITIRPYLLPTCEITHSTTPTSFPGSSNLKGPLGEMIRPDASRPSGWCGDVAYEVAWGSLVQGLGPPTNGSNATAFPSLPSPSSSSSSSCPSFAQIPYPSNHFSGPSPSPSPNPNPRFLFRKLLERLHSTCMARNPASHSHAAAAMEVHVERWRLKDAVRLNTDVCVVDDGGELDRVGLVRRDWP